jgi:anti-sigma factor RsiW
MSTLPHDEPSEPDDDLVAYLDGELDEPEAQSVEARLGTDEAVRREAESLRKTWDLLDYLPRPPEPAADFTSKTLDRLEKVTAPVPSGPTVVAAPRRRAVLRTAAKWVAVAFLLAAATAAGYFGRALFTAPKAKAAPQPEQDPKVLADLRVIDNLRLYVQADDFEYLKLLEKIDQFGPETPER